MKRDYLKNLDIGGAHLSDELIEQIMAEALKKQLVAYQRAEDIQPQESRRITLENGCRCREKDRCCMASGLCAVRQWERNL